MNRSDSDSPVPDQITGQSWTNSMLPVDDPRVIECVEQFHARFLAGERPDRDQLLRQFPELAPQLSACLDALQFIDVVAPQMKTFQGDADGVWPMQPLGDFRLLREIGRGGMGVVYEADQLSLGRRIALKVLPFAAILDPRQLQRFKNEAQAAAQLRHPNIVGIHFVGCDRGVHYYAMDLVRGQSLAEVLSRMRHASLKSESADGEDPQRTASPDGVSPDSEADAETMPVVALSTEPSIRSPKYVRAIANLGIQAAEAFEYAHQMGIVHRDVKPSNLLLDASGRLFVTDFGLAMTRTETNLTVSGDLLGTLHYMSPEQAAGKRTILDHRTDIYSLGVTLYEALTLRPAFPGTDRQELLRQIAELEPPLPGRVNRDIPSDLETIVLKSMAKEPEGRYGARAGAGR